MLVSGGFPTVSLSLFLGLVLAFLVKFLFFRGHKNLPHGSMGWPLLGETLGYLKPHKSDSMGVFLQEHCSRYGKVFKSHLFGHRTIVSCDHELNIFVLQNEEKLFQSSYPQALHGILGRLSLILVTGNVHRKLRSLIQGMIGGTKSTINFLSSIESLSIAIMESWKGKKQVVFDKEARRFTFNLIMKQSLGVEPDEAVTAKILENFHTFMEGFVSLPIHFPGTSYHKAVKAREKITTIIKEIIVERRKEKRPQNGDFLDEILGRENLSDEERVSLVMDLLLGGYETTATLLALLIYFLAHSPQALQQLREEHMAIRKNKKDGELLTWEDYKDMNFTLNVIFEGLRCGNVVKFVHRKALQDIRFKGYLIPAGWKVLPIFTGAHHDPSLHENPWDFNPWRWDDQETSKKVSFFGGGRRLCPGADLAKVETAFFLHHLVLNYRWKIKGDNFPLAYPYVEFKKDLEIEIEPIHRTLD